jgi:uncharacterized membrane protein YhaH (DUF805 family)
MDEPQSWQQEAPGRHQMSKPAKANEPRPSTTGARQVAGWTATASQVPWAPLTFSGAVRRVLFERYADFRGRAGLAEYWWFALAVFLLTFASSFLVFLGEPFLYLYPLVVLLLVVPAVAVGVRRLHDVGVSGWWWLLSVVPVLGAIVLLAFTVQRGDPGPNRYGRPSHG